MQPFFENSIAKLWGKSLLKLANIKNDWIVELSSEGINQALPLLNTSAKIAGPYTQRMAKLLAFRRQTRPEEFFYHINQMDSQLKQYMKQKLANNEGSRGGAKGQKPAGS